MKQVENRTKFNATLNNYLREVHCECPKCGESSIISAESKYSMPWRPYNVLLSCKNCMHRQNWNEEKDYTYFVNFNYSDGIEPYFGYQLTNHISIKGNPLSIFSPKHALDIAEYIEAEDRPHPENSKWSMVNRLPKWVKLAKNRKVVLKALSKIIA